MAKGWIVNLSRSDATQEVEREQAPVFTFVDGEPCFEVWFWHRDLKRWFVMSRYHDPMLMSHGVVFFTPEEAPDRLRARVKLMEKQAGIAA